MPNISVDYAILEKSTQISVVKSGFTWDDIGSFVAMRRIVKKQKDSNYPIGSSNYISLASENNIVHSKNHLVALLGVKNLTVVENNGVILVANVDAVKNIKKLREQAKEENL